MSVLGLGVMYLSTSVFQQPKVSISSVSEQQVGESVRVEGEVDNFYRTDSASFFTLRDDNSSLQVVDFERKNFVNGEEVVVTGQVDLYQGDLELVSTRIEQK